MKAKIMRMKPKDLYSDQLTLEQCRKMFKADKLGYTDEELIQMRDFLFKVAKFFYEFYMTTLRHRAKVISINNQPYGTEESNYLRQGEYRRAS